MLVKTSSLTSQCITAAFKMRSICKVHSCPVSEINIQLEFVRVCGRRVSAPLRVHGQRPFSVPQGIIRNRGSHNQEHSGAQT